MSKAYSNFVGEVGMKHPDVIRVNPSIISKIVTFDVDCIK